MVSARHTRPGKVLFITMDHMRADMLTGALANVAKLPNLRRLMTESVSFTNHFSVTTPCGPARASLLTGLYAMNHRSVRNGTPLADHHTNLALELRKVGREPLLFGYTDVAPDPTGKAALDPDLTSYEGLLPGFSEVVQLRFESNYAWIADLSSKGYDVSRYWTDFWSLFQAVDDGTGRLDAPTFYSADDSDTAFLTNEALKHMEIRRRQDWVAHLTYIRPHPPLAAPEPWNRLHAAADVPTARAVGDIAAERAMHPVIDAMFTEPKFTYMFRGFDGRLDAMDEDTRQTLRAIFMGLAAEVDHHLGRIFDWLKATGQWDDTLVVLTSDHGEMLGDHFMWGKQTVYDPCFHVPLIIRDPRNSATGGAVVDALTESIDIAPTILDWLGATPPAVFDGASLMPFLAGETPRQWRDHVFIEQDFAEPGDPTVIQRRLGLDLSSANAAILREKRWKYVHFNGGLPPLLFDLQADPNESRNLAGDPACAGELLRLARKMLDHRMAHPFRALSSIAITERGPVIG
jgi:arylsulfatase A-like enzyme